MKVIVADKISERGVKLLKEQREWKILQTTKETLRTEISDADALIVRSATKVTAELLEKAGKLRVVGRAGVGVDNIDLEAATKRGVLVMSTPGGNAVSVAEHTFALMLALARQVPRLDKAIHEGRWEKSSAAGTEVRGKTLGLIGLGRIGSEVAVRADGFDMRVLGYDPFISEAAAQELNVELVALDTLLAESDFISLHTALSPATENLINAESIAKMKSGARIINAARGELIDEAALAAALESGKLAGAAVDVFREEPPPKNSPLMGLSNVIGTPHVAGSTAEAQEEVGTQVAVQVRDYLSEGIIRNAVNLPALSPDQYRRVRPYLDLAQRLGSMVSQLASSRPARIRIRYAGEAAEVGTHLLRSAVLAGVLNSVLEEKVNVVNAPAVAAARGLRVEEETRRREHGFANTLEVAVLTGASGEAGVVVEGTVLVDGTPRVLQIDGISVEAQLEGTILYLTNRDEPGVVGQVGSTLGKLGVNIATFALGRREAHRGSDAVALVRLDGEVAESVAEAMRGIRAITAAKLLRLG
jgi:D-3-phosphoglycerate dehydrogenase